MSRDERKHLAKSLASKEYRDALVDAEIGNGIAFQIKAMQHDRGWTQAELATRAGTAQPLISKYLSGYENYSLTTLKSLASAFDVALIVSFAPFSELADRFVSKSHATMAVPDFAHDAKLRTTPGQSTVTSVTHTQPVTYQRPLLYDPTDNIVVFDTYRRGTQRDVTNRRGTASVDLKEYAK